MFLLLLTLCCVHRWSCGYHKSKLHNYTEEISYYVTTHPSDSHLKTCTLLKSTRFVNFWAIWCHFYNNFDITIIKFIPCQLNSMYQFITIIQPLEISLEMYTIVLKQPVRKWQERQLKPFQHSAFSKINTIWSADTSQCANVASVLWNLYQNMWPTACSVTWPIRCSVIVKCSKTVLLIYLQRENVFNWKMGMMV